MLVAVSIVEEDNKYSPVLVAPSVVPNVVSLLALEMPDAAVENSDDIEVLALTMVSSLVDDV